MKSKIKKTIATLLLACFLMSITASAATYNVWTVTGKAKDAGTDCYVYINIIGTKGQTGPTILDAQGDDFESGHEDVFVLENMNNVGSIKNVQICLEDYDNSYNPGWNLKTVRVEGAGSHFEGSYKKDYIYPKECETIEKN